MLALITCGTAFTNGTRDPEASGRLGVLPRSGGMP